MNLSEFLNMGGYGPYVWSCYGLTFAVLALNVWNARRELREQIVHSKRRLQSSLEGGS